MKFLLYIFLLFSLASLGLAKGSGCCWNGPPCGDGCHCCLKRSSERSLDGRLLNTVKGLFIRDPEDMVFVEMNPKALARLATLDHLAELES